VSDTERDTGQPPVSRAAQLAGPSTVDRWGFAVRETGRIVGDCDIAVSVGESMLYIGRVADAIGYQLGAGALETIEVFGRANAYTAVGTDADGSLILRGCVAPSGSSPEELRAWHEARSTR
jgi:hypothetical protein